MIAFWKFSKLALCSAYDGFWPVADQLPTFSDRICYRARAFRGGRQD